MPDPTLADVLEHVTDTTTFDWEEQSDAERKSMALALQYVLTNREWLALVEWERAVRSVAGVPHETPIRTVDGQFAGITPHRDPLLKKLVVIVGANWKPEAGR